VSVEIITMFVYLFVAFALVIVAIPQWQAAGQEYLEHVFSTKERAEAVNRLLVTGLSLITLSLALFLVGLGSPRTPTDAVTTLFLRLAALLAVVGAAFLTNLGAYGYLGNRIQDERDEDAEDAEEKASRAEQARTEAATPGRTPADTTGEPSTPFDPVITADPPATQADPGRSEPQR
jgi:hypothetical protein